MTKNNQEKNFRWVKIVRTDVWYIQDIVYDNKMGGMGRRKFMVTNNDEIV